MSQELQAIIMPGGDVQLEWSRSEERIHKSLFEDLNV